MLLKRVQVNPYGLKLNVTCQVLIYADVNILGYGVNAVKKTESLVAVIEENGRKANGNKLSV